MARRLAVLAGRAICGDSLLGIFLVAREAAPCPINSWGGSWSSPFWVAQTFHFARAAPHFYSHGEHLCGSVGLMLAEAKFDPNSSCLAKTYPMHR